MPLSTSYTSAIQALVEVTSRTVRRGRAKELEELHREMNSIVQKLPKPVDDYELGYGNGMFHALRGTIEFAFFRSKNDKLVEDLRARRHTVPALHELARAKIANEKISIGELSEALGVLPQNMGAVVKFLEERELVNTHRQGVSRIVAVTTQGVEALSLVMPEWDGAMVEQTTESADWNNALRQKVILMRRHMLAQRSGLGTVKEPAHVHLVPQNRYRGYELIQPIVEERSYAQFKPKMKPAERMELVELCL